MNYDLDLDKEPPGTESVYDYMFKKKDEGGRSVGIYRHSCTATDLSCCIGLAYDGDDVSCIEVVASKSGCKDINVVIDEILATNDLRKKIKRSHSRSSNDLKHNLKRLGIIL